MRLIDAEALKKLLEEDKACGGIKTDEFDKGYDIGLQSAIEKIDNAPTVDLRLMKCEECAGHTLDYAMGWKACIEWLKQGGDTQYFDKEAEE